MDELVKPNESWRLLNRVVNVFSFGRGGSGLMSSLLDNHPRLIAFPDCLLMGYQEWWDGLRSHESESVAADFLDLYQVLFVPDFVHPYREIPGSGNTFALTQNFTSDVAVDRQAFSGHLREFLVPGAEESAGRFFRKIHAALLQTMGQSASRDHVIVHGSHMPRPRRHVFMANEFDDVQNLHMVREPVLSFVSWFKSGPRHLPNAPYPAIDDLLYNMNKNYSPLPQWVDTSRAVRLEDLHAEPEAVMREVVDWIGVPWDPCVLEPTFLGKPWRFGEDALYERPFNEKITSFDRHSDVLSTAMHYYLARHVRFQYASWGYQVPPRPSLLERVRFAFGLPRSKSAASRAFRFPLAIRVRLISDVWLTWDRHTPPFVPLKKILKQAWRGTVRRSTPVEGLGEMRGAWLVVSKGTASRAAGLRRWVHESPVALLSGLPSRTR